MSISIVDSTKLFWANQYPNKMGQSWINWHFKNAVGIFPLEYKIAYVFQVDLL